MPIYELLRRLSGQHIDHQIFLKFLDMLFLAINYHKTPKKNPYDRDILDLKFSICLYRALLFKEVNIGVRMVIII